MPRSAHDRHSTSLHAYNRIPLQPDINPASANIPTMHAQSQLPLQNSRFAAARPEINHTALYIDVPELQEDLYYSSPPSASSENMIITPPPMSSQDRFVDYRLPPVSSEAWLNASRSPTDAWRFDTLISSTTRSSESSRCSEKESSIWNMFTPPTSNFYYQAMMPVDQPEISGFPINDSLAYSAPSERRGFSSNSLDALPSSLSSVPLSLESPYIPPPVPVPVQQLPIKLHQPRPSRCIPIISLSDIASACDSDSDGAADSPQHSPFDHFSSSSLDDTYQPHALRTERRTDFSFTGETDPYKDHSRTLATTQQVIKCACGCMGSYLIHS